MAAIAGLEEFAAVVRLGGFSRAARALGTSTSFVSRQVSRLETELGTALLIRSTRSVRQTPMGELVYKRASALLSGMTDLRMEVLELTAAPRGHIRLTTAAGYAQHRLARPLAAFSRSYPNVTIDLVLTDAVLDLDQDEIDIAIRFGPLPDSSLLRRSLAPSRAYVCASPAYLSEHGTPSSMEELSRHRCLVAPHVSWRLKGGRTWATRSAALTASSVAALTTLAIAGAGLAYLPDFYADTAIRAGDLVPVLQDQTPDNIEVSLLFRKQTTAMPFRLRKLIDALSDGSAGT